MRPSQYSVEDRLKVARVADGFGATYASRRFGIPEGTVRHWLEKLRDGERFAPGLPDKRRREVTRCIRCDRCGKVIESDDDWLGAVCVYGRNADDGRMDVPVADLCQPCSKELRKWLRGDHERLS